MKILSISLLIIMTVSINSCKSKKAVSKKENLTVKTKSEINNIDFIEQGYSKGVVIFDASKSEPCNYLIRLNKSETLEPRLFSNKDCKVNNQKVWLKFTRQRRLSRCVPAQPVEIIDIKKRDE